MNFLAKLFDKSIQHHNESNKQLLKQTAISVRNTSLHPSRPMLTVHPDIKNFLWIGDGECKNYYPEPSNNTTTIRAQGITFTITIGGAEEPSLIYINLPVSGTNCSVERPPYYPTYKGLTPEQRSVYWKLLSNPYDNTIDIGYVFILYYGLERYLLSDRYEEVIDLILKLRDIHSNRSFQTYTANAVILTCLHRQRADIVQKFLHSLDKEYEFCFSPNLFLLCKYSLGSPLTGVEIMRMAKSFEFKKDTYIKKYPDLFLKKLSENISRIYNSETIPWNRLLKISEFNKLPLEVTTIFANVSIQDKTIKVPSLLSSFMMKKTIYDLLDKTHEDVKKQLSEKRKNGEEIPEAKRSSSKKNTEVLTFDEVQEQKLLNTYDKAKDNSLEQHFASNMLQDFYYKYRNLDKRYLYKCIAYCKDDISRLSEIQKLYMEEEKKESFRINGYLLRKDRPSFLRSDHFMVIFLHLKDLQ